MSVSPAIIEKIKKILAKSINNTSQAEAETALLMAQRMLAEHGLSMRDVTEVAAAPKQTQDQAATEIGRLKWWSSTLAQIISDNFKCFTYINVTRQGRQIMFFGYATDLELCISVYNYAKEMLEHHSKEYIKNIKTHRGQCVDRTLLNAVQNDYIKGFMAGLKAKFAEQVKTNPGFALVLVKDKEVTAAWDRYSRRFRHSSSRGVNSASDQNARAAGFSQGKSFAPVAGYIK